PGRHAGPRGDQGRGQRGLPGRRGRPAQGLPALHRGPHRVLRHRRHPVLLHLRLAADHGVGQSGQGHRLVRQRVGLLQPDRRPDRPGRRVAPGALMLSVDDLDVSGATVLLRADLNVPLDKAGTTITDDGRIRASLPVIRKLTSRGARVLIAAHLGRPKGADYAERAAGGPSLAPVAARLAELLGQPVPLAGDVAGPSAAEVAAKLADGDVALLENVRFEPAETSKDDAERAGLARRLAAMATLYVGDGFGALHRKHASVYDVPALLPAAAGDLVLDEVAVLRRLTGDAERPYVVVLGGAKPSDKLG